jgi:nucleoside-diphosphate-sugar epimerase
MEKVLVSGSAGFIGGYLVEELQRRVPATAKAKRIFGLDARATPDDMPDEVIPWIPQAVEAGTI